MRKLHKMVGKNLVDMGTSEHIRIQCKMHSIKKWACKRMQEWNANILRMKEDRSVRIAKDVKDYNYEEGHQRDAGNHSLE